MVWASPLTVPVLRRTPRGLRTECPTALFLYLSLRLHHGLLLYRSAHNLGVLLNNSLETFSPQFENQKKPQ